MPALCAPDEIRRILNTDPGWAVFALGDLAPPYSEHAAWYRPASGVTALAMVYRAFRPPVLFAMGDAREVAGLLDEIAEPALYLHVRAEVLPALRKRYREVEPKPMWRMLLDRARYRPEGAGGVERLDGLALSALQRLYADGNATGEAPGFFLPGMLDDGAFFGIREGAELIAAAGTQLVVPAEGVAAIGNIYTRRDRRGGGLAGALTSAVTDDLLRRRIPTIALNVAQANAPAVRVYERLGFVRHCEYIEGTARR